MAKKQNNHSSQRAENKKSSFQEAAHDKKNWLLLLLLLLLIWFAWKPVADMLASMFKSAGDTQLVAPLNTQPGADSANTTDGGGSSSTTTRSATGGGGGTTTNNSTTTNTSTTNNTSTEENAPILNGRALPQVYADIQNGQTKEEVIAIAGQPSTCTASLLELIGNQEVCVWLSGKYKIVVTFNDNKVVLKAGVGF